MRTQGSSGAYSKGALVLRLQIIEKCFEPMVLPSSTTSDADLGRRMPRDVAERIAYKNASRLFGRTVSGELIGNR